MLLLGLVGAKGGRCRALSEPYADVRSPRALSFVGPVLLDQSDIWSVGNTVVSPLVPERENVSKANTPRADRLMMCMM